MSSARVYIGHLPSRATERDLEHFFRGYGRIRDVMLKNGFGFVEFDDSRDADDAVYDLNGRELLGERVIVELSRRGPRGGGGGGGAGGGGGGGGGAGNRPGLRYGPPIQTRYRLGVYNLSTRCSWQELKDMMRRYAEVTYADAHKKPNEGFVCFANRDDMRRAIDKFQGKDINGRRIKLVDESEGGGGGGRRTRSRSRSPRSRSRSPRSRSPRSRSPRSRSRSSPPSRHDSRSPVKNGRSRSRSRTRDETAWEGFNYFLGAIVFLGGPSECFADDLSSVCSSVVTFFHFAQMSVSPSFSSFGGLFLLLLNLCLPFAISLQRHQQKQQHSDRFVSEDDTDLLTVDAVPRFSDFVRFSPFHYGLSLRKDNSQQPKLQFGAVSLEHFPISAPENGKQRNEGPFQSLGPFAFPTLFSLIRSGRLFPSEQISDRFRPKGKPTEVEASQFAHELPPISKRRHRNREAKTLSHNQQQLNESFREKLLKAINQTKELKGKGGKSGQNETKGRRKEEGAGKRERAEKQVREKEKAEGKVGKGGVTRKNTSERKKGTGRGM
ncbi:hypothetical protein niasHT_008899 [Heterodera trifolii]|uniref:RRM domain-containing protein n=1 Tax=Heterodera trifolii TaxID=157864 RepID=A0ABD2M028_9BILA